MKKNIILIIFIVIKNFAYSQNIAPNPSFEDTSGAYTKTGIIYIPATYWNSFGNSPDFFYTGNYDFSGVPNNGFGFQIPHSGNNYCGIYSYLDFVNKRPYREFIGAKLIENLEIGKRYFVNLKVSLADSANCGTNNIGVKFSNQIYSDSNSVRINNKPHIRSQKIILEKNKWVSISGSFVADSTYNYLIIGNFNDDNSTQRTILKGLDCTAYYYIDDVCVSTDSLLCNSDFDSTLLKYNVVLYPNPTLDKFKLDSKEKIDKSSIRIYDVWGREITAGVGLTPSVNKHQIYFDVSMIPAGMYVIKCTDDALINYQLKFIKL
ncbi:MAG: hypothetical protein RL065_1481 [Bacteroidota bacterium]|jgi:hypothetical protein